MTDIPRGLEVSSSANVEVSTYDVPLTSSGVSLELRGDNAHLAFESSAAFPVHHPVDVELTLRNHAGEEVACGAFQFENDAAKFGVERDAAGDLGLLLGNWRQKHDESMGQKWDAARVRTFRDNLKTVSETNEKKLSYKFALTRFAALSSVEMKAYKGYVAQDGPTGSTESSVVVADLPKEVDWRKKGAVNAVRNQAQCGSCWAFSAVAGLEGAYFVARGELPQMSEEDIVECDDNAAGCSGGNMAEAVLWVIDGHGIDSQGSYPYSAGGGHPSKCHEKKVHDYPAPLSYTPLSGYKNILAASVDVPLIIGVNAGPLQLYHSGIFDPEDCDPDMLDHGVGISGYGTTSDGADYWIVRNSWAETWGEKGYVRIARGKKGDVGVCGMLTMAGRATYQPEAEDSFTRATLVEAEDREEVSSPQFTVYTDENELKNIAESSKTAYVLGTSVKIDGERWCPFCRKADPIIAKYMSALDDSAGEFLEYDEPPHGAGKWGLLGEPFNLEGIPMLFKFVDGKLVEKLDDCTNDGKVRDFFKQ